MFASFLIERVKIRHKNHKHIRDIVIFGDQILLVNIIQPQTEPLRIFQNGPHARRRVPLSTAVQETVAWVDGPSRSTSSCQHGT